MKKIIYALAFSLLMMAIAYFSGKKIGEYAKNNNFKNALSEKQIEKNH